MNMGFAWAESFFHRIPVNFSLNFMKNYSLQKIYSRLEYKYKN